MTNLNNRLLALVKSDEPTDADLAAIEAEWPLIAAELDVLDAEIIMLYAEDRGGPSPLDWRRVRRAQRRVIDARSKASATSLAPPGAAGTGVAS